MKIIKKICRWWFSILLIPILYLGISLILSSITLHQKESANKNEVIFLTTNGVHLDIVIPIISIDTILLKDLKYRNTDRYLSFGWGDENFYLHTPTWQDLTFRNAFSALFLKSTTLMHVTQYSKKRENWIPVRVNQTELKKLNVYIATAFKTTATGKKIILKNKGYAATDNFYKSTGSYSCFNTCNSWVNRAFKNSDLKSCLWTPFDFGLLRKYQ